MAQESDLIYPEDIKEKETDRQMFRIGYEDAIAQERPRSVLRGSGPYCRGYVHGFIQRHDELGKLPELPERPRTQVELPD